MVLFIFRANNGLLLIQAINFAHTKHIKITHFFFLHVIYIHWTFFFIIKPNRCTNFPNSFWHENLHVSGSSSARHQEFIHCTLGTGICPTGLKTDFK
jgi:hypothetical protein